MDANTLSSDIDSERVQNSPQQAEGAFNASWQATDAALLQPSNLAIHRTQRAWDRKPLSPFSRQRLRVGKVWKRPATLARHASSNVPPEADRSLKRRKARTSLAGPLKPVKKMCLESDFGMVPRVSQWERLESPARKILTRSNALDADIVALPDVKDPEMSEDEGDVTVEICDEDGTVLDVGGNELAQSNDWEDEPGQDTSDHEEQPYDTTFHEAFASPDDAVNDEANIVHPHAERISTPSQLLNEADIAITMVDTGPVDERELPSSSSEVAPEHFQQLSHHHPLPDGFVSPVKRSQSARRRRIKQDFDSRRRTLPSQFVFNSAHEADVRVEDLEPQPTPMTSVEEDPAEHYVEFSSMNHLSTANSPGGSDVDQDWEDIEEDVVPSGSFIYDQLRIVHDTEPGTSMALVDFAGPGTDAEVTQDGEVPLTDAVNDPGTSFVVQQAWSHADAKLPSSPIPSIDGPHPRLPLRRSPRRKSSSPLKQSTVWPSAERSHLIAFTPIKAPCKRFLLHEQQPDGNQSFQEEEDYPEPASPIERAASAPPEEPNMSPHKPTKPRVSDDTALLQAFLNRAAETKGFRRISMTKKRESMTNRRDSDTIRQALASPAKGDVLGDLDPNSPSPRKPLADFNYDRTYNIIEVRPMSSPERLRDVHDGPVTRRSDRAARRAQPEPLAVPNKISIRGNTEYTVLKRTEAQEMALLTRNNTRKNKGGAVLPPIRLSKLGNQAGTSEVDSSTEDVERALEGPPGRRNVRWNVILVEFYSGGEVSEASVLSDELNESSQTPQTAQTDGEDRESAKAGPPPAAETPSKPKMRRLKPSRTAATPGKAPAPPLEPDTDWQTDTVLDSKGQAKSVLSTKRRSRIATPAKGLTNASLLPSDLEMQTQASARPAEKKPVTKKKAPSSKLPAPTASSTTLGQGKENLISSPPKKQRGPPSAKAFAPKLDFGSKNSFQADDTTTAPGLASPAKKGKSGGSVFGNVPVLDFGPDKREEVLGLRSPAKKRTRRTVGL